MKATEQYSPVVLFFYGKREFVPRDQFSPWLSLLPKNK